ncbi:hypothetical protein B0T26DRAFT_670090 [Lasiosphaeria miniovina]|uniref:Uncharacterized protein n=1 Tax=Lasiosphaeria miniovina TaxID=1954250 RepID=A0AA40BGA9_9PEZI|nr:uncharacterized protein B0T26DRAFT_670090 [Lasiosphaeria miniovina]KAK0733711.1 hypothetical protein B0T26DRAFT_670090 [Lasiosphaeria miniovina]
MGTVRKWKHFNHTWHRNRKLNSWPNMGTVRKWKHFNHTWHRNRKLNSGLYSRKRDFHNRTGTNNRWAKCNSLIAFLQWRRVTTTPSSSGIRSGIQEQQKPKGSGIYFSPYDILQRNYILDSRYLSEAFQGFCLAMVEYNVGNAARQWYGNQLDYIHD